MQAFCKASGIKFMPVAHIYANGVLQEAMPLGAKVYGRFPRGWADYCGQRRRRERRRERRTRAYANADADVVAGPEPRGL